LRIHAELPLHRITPVVAGWLRRLEPLGHGNPEPLFLARGARLAAEPRVLKEKHLRLELRQDLRQELRQDPRQDGGSADSRPTSPTGSAGAIRAVAWGMAERGAALGLRHGTALDVAYRIRENDHPEFGGLEIEIAGMQPSAS
jgi:single-stranded-DNA-specific exonuclease